MSLTALQAVLRGIKGTPLAASADPLMTAFARLAERYLEPWTAIEVSGSKGGGRRRGGGREGEGDPLLCAVLHMLFPCMRKFEM